VIKRALQLVDAQPAASNPIECCMGHGMAWSAGNWIFVYFSLSAQFGL
jgi:hypothetical protein